MGKGGGGQNTTTVQKADPWGPLQPALTSLYDSALDTFNNYRPQFYPNQTVAGFFPETDQALSLASQRATQGNPLNPLSQLQAGRTLSDYYISNNPFSERLEDIATQPTEFNLATQGLEQMGQGVDIPGLGILSQIGSGAMLGSNPYIDDTFRDAASSVGDQFRKNVLPGVASMFSGAGRYGSNSMADAVGQSERQYGDTLNRLATNIYGGNYADERRLQQQALGLLGSESLAGTGLQQQALSTLGQLDTANSGLQLGALEQLQNSFGRERAMQLSMAGLGPQLANQDYLDINQLLGVGGTREAKAQQLLNSDISRWDFAQNQPYALLQQLNSILNGGIGGLSGMTGSGSTSGGGSSPLMGALGGGMMGAQVLPMLGASGALGSTAAASTMMGGAGLNALGGMALGPLGLLAGALLGGLFS